MARRLVSILVYLSRLSLISLFCGLLLVSRANAEKLASIIIDDIGNNLSHARAVIDLPFPATLAILPDSGFAHKIASLAQKKNREVMLHLPLQSIENHQHKSPGTLHLHMTKNQFIEQLNNHLRAVPFIKGINSHMGSLLTQHPGHMEWLMQSLAEKKNFYFVDSLTTKKSVARSIALQHSIPALERDVFLDPDFQPSTIAHQFKKFISLTKQKGYAIAIAHPHPNSINYLKDHTHEIQEAGISILPVSELIQKIRGKEHVTCAGSTCSGL